MTPTQARIAEIKELIEHSKSFGIERLAVIIKNACYYDDSLNEHVIKLITESINGLPWLLSETGKNATGFGSG